MMNDRMLSDQSGNEQELNSVSTLVTALSISNEEDTMIFDLKFGNHGQLTIGVGYELGFVQYMPENLNPPYLAAVNKTYKQSQSNSDFVIFDCGGTPTEIPSEFCLPMEIVKDICIHFFASGNLPGWVDWIPV